MSTVYEYATGQFHIHVKLAGELDKIELFHAIIEKIDGSWPWGPSKGNHGTVRVCRKCKGFLLSNPRFAPQDLKAAGEQAGIHIKIYGYSPQLNCFEGTEYQHTESIDRVACRALYGHKPKRITVLGGKLWIGDSTPTTGPRLIEAVDRKVIELPSVAPKDSQLVN
jgi:hypothetical protein